MKIKIKINPKNPKNWKLKKEKGLPKFFFNFWMIVIIASLSPRGA